MIKSQDLVARVSRILHRWPISSHQVINFFGELMNVDRAPFEQIVSVLRVSDLWNLRDMSLVPLDWYCSERLDVWKAVILVDSVELLGVDVLRAPNELVVTCDWDCGVLSLSCLLLEEIFCIDCVKKLFFFQHLNLSRHLCQSHDIIIILILLCEIIILSVVFIKGNCSLLPI